MSVRLRNGRAAIASATLLLALPVCARSAGVPTPVTDEPHTISATFVLPSYASGEMARLRILTGPQRIALELCRVGPAHSRTRRNDVLDGVPVMKTRYVHPGLVRLRMPTAPSDLYFVRLSAPGGWLGHATVIL